MSQQTTLSVTTDALDAKIWAANLTPAQIKSYAQISKVNQETEEARWKRRKDVFMTVGGLIMLIMVAAASLYAALVRDEAGAWPIVSAIVAGFYSYHLRRPNGE